MHNAITLRPSAHGRVRKSAFIAALISGGLALVLASTGFAAPPGSAQDQIEDLVVCYARGTDTLGRAVNAVGGQPLDSTVNLVDPVFAAGLAIYRECFADDFSFTLSIGGTPLLTVPSPATVTPSTDAALEWANFVNNSFRSAGYRNTQHHMGSISSTVNGNEGTVESYLIATLAYGPTSALTGVQLNGGTYTDTVVRVNGRWLIQKRRFNITSSVHVPAGP